MKSVDAIKQFAKAFNESGCQEYDSEDGALCSLEEAVFDEIWRSDDARDEASGHCVIDVSKIVLKSVFEKIKESGVVSEEQYASLLEEYIPEEKDKNSRIPKDEQDAMAFYELICDDDVAEFYFLHCLNSKITKEKLLANCIDHEDEERLDYVMALMEKTQDYADFYELNGWGRDIEVILCALIDEYNRRMHRSYPPFATDKNIEILCNMVERIIPILSETAQKNVKHTLIKIQPNKDTEQQYIEQLLEDAHIYCMKRKPRGMGGAPNINRMSQGFIDCFSQLEQMDRLDVVVEIMSIFKAADQIKPIPYESWLSFMRSGLSEAAYKKVKRKL